MLSRLAATLLALCTGCGWFDRAPRGYLEPCETTADCEGQLECHTVKNESWCAIGCDTSDPDSGLGPAYAACTLACETAEDCPVSKGCDGDHDPCEGGLCTAANCA